MEQISYLILLLAGMASFLSPCVLPLAPAYISYICGTNLKVLSAGAQGTAAHASTSAHNMSASAASSIGTSANNMSANNMSAGDMNANVASAGAARPRSEVNAERLSLVLASGLFVAGFSTVFILLGASASMLGKIILRNSELFTQISGAALIILGLQVTGLIRIPFLDREFRASAPSADGMLLRNYGIGLAFGFGWTPCIGPQLVLALNFASHSETLTSGILMLSVYSFGLGIPFILIALFGTEIFAFARTRPSIMRNIQVIMGLILIATGVLFISGAMYYVASLMLDAMPFLARLG